MPERLRWAAHACVNRGLSVPAVPSELRAVGLRLLGHRIEGHLGSGVHLLGPSRLTMAKGSFVNAGCLIDLSAEVVIGDHVHLAPRVCLYTSTHALGGAACRAGPVVTAPVVLEAGCWIGANAIILPGVTLGAGVVIAAGSVVTKSLLEPGIYGGTPARLLKPL